MSADRTMAGWRTPAILHSPACVVLRSWLAAGHSLLLWQCRQAGQTLFADKVAICRDTVTHWCTWKSQATVSKVRAWSSVRSQADISQSRALVYESAA